MPKLRYRPRTDNMVRCSKLQLSPWMTRYGEVKGGPDKVSVKMEQTQGCCLNMINGTLGRRLEACLDIVRQVPRLHRVFR